jgi:cytoskeletal protein RodZ
MVKSANIAHLNNTSKTLAEQQLPGTILKNARLAAGLSIADVVSKLFIAKHYIEHIENNEFDKLPDPVFVTGYMTTYFRFFKYTPEQINSILHNYKQFEHKQNIQTAKSQLNRKQTKIFNLRTLISGVFLNKWLLPTIALFCIFSMLWYYY